MWTCCFGLQQDVEASLCFPWLKKNARSWRECAIVCTYPKKKKKKHNSQLCVPHWRQPSSGGVSTPVRSFEGFFSEWLSSVCFWITMFSHHQAARASGAKHEDTHLVAVLGPGVPLPAKGWRDHFSKSENMRQNGAWRYNVTWCDTPWRTYVGTFVC